MLQRFLFLIPVSVLAVASIVASGGGGGDSPAPADTGGSGGPSGNNTGGAVTLSGTCPPLNVGDTWTNRVTRTIDGSITTETTTVISNNGSEAVIEQAGEGYATRTRLAISGESVFEVGADDGEYTWNPRLPICPRPNVGEQYLQQLADGSTRTEVTITSISEESVTVPAGTYTAIKMVADATLYFGTSTFQGTRTDWFVDGIGPVKTVVDVDGDVNTEELVAYDFSGSGGTGGTGGDTGGTGGDTGGTGGDTGGTGGDTGGTGGDTGGTGGDTGGAGGDTGGTGGDTGTGSGSTLTYSGADLGSLGDGVFAPSTYPDADLPESDLVAVAAWFELGFSPEPGLSLWLYWLNGELASVFFGVSVATEVVGEQVEYRYYAECRTSPAVCAAVSFDVVNQRVTFNNVVVPVEVQDILDNVATSPVTLNGTVSMYEP